MGDDTYVSIYSHVGVLLDITAFARVKVYIYIW